MSEHSPAPFRFEPVEEWPFGGRIVDANGQPILAQAAICCSTTQVTREENLECRGFPANEIKEAQELVAMQEANFRLWTAAPETAAERDRLREVNAELLAAMKAMVREFGCGTDFHCRVCNSARTAIAKAERKS